MSGLGRYPQAIEFGNICHRKFHENRQLIQIGRDFLITYGCGMMSISLAVLQCWNLIKDMFRHGGASNFEANATDIGHARSWLPPRMISVE